MLAGSAPQNRTNGLCRDSKAKRKTFLSNMRPESLRTAKPCARTTPSPIMKRKICCIDSWSRYILLLGIRSMICLSLRWDHSVDQIKFPPTLFSEYYHNNVRHLSLVL